MQYIRERLNNKDHFFREELLGSLLTAHIFDLYDIHARSQNLLQVSEHISAIVILISILLGCASRCIIYRKFVEK